MFNKKVKNQDILINKISDQNVIINWEELGIVLSIERSLEKHSVSLNITSPTTLITYIDKRTNNQEEIFYYTNDNSHEKIINSYKESLDYQQYKNKLKEKENK